MSVCEHAREWLELVLGDVSMYQDWLWRTGMHISRWLTHCDYKCDLASGQVVHNSVSHHQRSVCQLVTADSSLQLKQQTNKQSKSLPREDGNFGLGQGLVLQGPKHCK
jgi:hypothetical protein